MYNGAIHNAIYTSLYQKWYIGISNQNVRGIAKYFSHVFK